MIIVIYLYVNVLYVKFNKKYCLKKEMGYFSPWCFVYQDS